VFSGYSLAEARTSYEWGTGLGERGWVALDRHMSS
jgi:hypothetical protein